MAGLADLIQQKNLAFRSSFIGKQLSAVTLVSPKRNLRTAWPRTPTMTDNFISIDIAATLPPNLLVSAQVTGLTPHGLSAILAGEIRSIA